MSVFAYNPFKERVAVEGFYAHKVTVRPFELVKSDFPTR